MAGRQAKLITPAQLRAALKRVRARRYPARDQVMLLLSHRAGMRVSEVVGVQWSMLLDSSGALAEHIALENNICKKGSGRSIPIHPDLRSALLRLRRETGSDGHVIKSERGERMRATSAVNWFRALYADLGLQQCSSHSGRRSFLTFCARALARTGGSLRDVQLLAGHRDLATTQKYIEGDARAQRKLVSLI